MTAFHAAQALETIVQLATQQLRDREAAGVPPTMEQLRHLAHVQAMAADEMDDYREWLEDMGQAEVDQERHEIDHEPWGEN